MLESRGACKPTCYYIICRSQYVLIIVAVFHTLLNVMYIAQFSPVQSGRDLELHGRTEEKWKYYKLVPLKEFELLLSSKWMMTLQVVT